MQAMNQTVPVSQKTYWVGRIMSGLPALFLLVDGVMKLVKPARSWKELFGMDFPKA
jgi:hypothetical protein